MEISVLYHVQNLRVWIEMGILLSRLVLNYILNSWTHLGTTDSVDGMLVHGRFQYELPQ